MSTMVHSVIVQLATGGGSLEVRLIAGFLALLGVVSAIWPVRFNRTLSHGLIERYLWDDPGPVLIWTTRAFSVAFAVFWGWIAVSLGLPPFLR